MSFALVLKKTSWYRRRYSHPLRVKIQDILNRAMNRRVTMETDTKKAPHTASFFFFCLKLICILIAYHHLNGDCAIIFLFSASSFNH